MAESERAHLEPVASVDVHYFEAQGLGARLHAHLAGKSTVVGVPKTAYRTGAFAARVPRGASGRPLFGARGGRRPYARRGRPRPRLFRVDRGHLAV
jgi:hypothetical protein